MKSRPRIQANKLHDGDRLIARYWQRSWCWTWGKAYTVRGGAVRCNFGFPHGIELMEQNGEFDAFRALVCAGEGEQMAGHQTVTGGGSGSGK
jgi:hypothetical protein